MTQNTPIVVPALGESVTEATVIKWLKNIGEAVAIDEPIVELETDKVTLEVNSPAAGFLASIECEEGADVAIGAVLGSLSTEAVAGAVTAPAAQKTPEAAPAAQSTSAPASNASVDKNTAAPSVQRLASEHNLDPQTVSGTGKDGRVTKGDMMTALAAPQLTPKSSASDIPMTKRVKMPRLRKRIAERLKEAQNNAAILSTFNEIDMTNVMALRSQYKDDFQKKYGVKLGFMSFFVKACIQALQDVPQLNAMIDGDDIVYHQTHNIGVAVGTEQGLVVPVLKQAEDMSFVDIEQNIMDYAIQARSGKLGVDALSGGTFTISNGGVYGSLLSTPILNPPQSGILGMHKTQRRPVAIGDKIEIRPMMYVALSYDHRLIDGKEAVTFLVRVKDLIEDPQRLLLSV
jgi:2-oxoglutarate dehydrogenase E2 component (dihydrolipoamide succinyltransferase)